MVLLYVQTYYNSLPSYYLGYNIIKNNFPDNNIVRNNIFLRPEEAMMKAWQKLVLNEQISVYREYQNLVLHPLDPSVFCSIW